MLSNDELRVRLVAVERRVHRAYVALTGLGLLCGGLVMATIPRAWATQEQAVQNIIRTRGVIVVDEAGTERIVIGKAPGQRRSPQHGIMINDVKGDERFGVGIADDGLMGMGFDAPVGVGDQRNRERMYLSVGPTGSPTLHMLGNDTRIYTRLTTVDNQAWLEFLDWGRRGVDSVMRIGLPQARRLGERAR